MFILYAMLVIAALLFYIQYEGALSLLLFIFVLLMPISLYVITIYLSRRLKAKLTIENISVSAGQSVPLEIKINNPTILPIACVDIVLGVKVSSAEHIEYIHINTPVFPNNSQMLNTAFSSEHFGLIQIKIECIRVYDMFKLSHIKVKNSNIDSKTSPIIILPQPIDLSCTVLDYSDQILESELYSPDKPGDDPSEIFAIRDYADGDRMSRIHWKLTAKADKLMVKDYSQPLADVCMIMVDTYVGSDSKSKLIYDTEIELAASLSGLLLEHNVRHRISCYVKDEKELSEFSISDYESYIYAATGLLKAGTANKAGEAAKISAMRRETAMQFIHLIYVCSKIDEQIIAAISAGGLANRYSILYCHESGKELELPETDIEIIPVEHGRIEQSVSELVL